MTFPAPREVPPTLTDSEQDRVLRASKVNPRDHMIISTALGTALREHEIAALDVGDVWDGEKIRRRVVLRVFKGHDPAPPKGKRPGKKSERRPRPKPQYVMVADVVASKLARYLAWRFSSRTSGRLTPRETRAIDPSAPLFLSREGNRIATRTIRHLWREWQKEARIRPPYPFHRLRHTAISNAFRLNKNIGTAKKMARHANLKTTSVYTHVSDEEMLEELRGIRA